MAKQVCSNCGVEVGLLKRIKMTDGNYVCRKCASQTHPLFEPVNDKNFVQFSEHLKQLEEGKILFEKLFVPRQKPADKAKKLKKLSSNVLVAEDIGLVAFVQKRGQILFWGGTPYYMVFRMADLYRYDYVPERGFDRNGKDKVQYFSHFAFRNTAGCNAFKVEMMIESQCINIIRYFDGCFGLKRDFSSLANSWKQQLANLKTAAKGLKNIFSGNAEKEEQEESVEQLSEAVFNELYGDRTGWSAKADAAIKEALGK